MNVCAWCSCLVAGLYKKLAFFPHWICPTDQKSAHRLIGDYHLPVK